MPKGQVFSTIGDQLLRSASSVGANIVEAKFWLSLLRDSGKAEKEATDKLLKEAAELSNILAASILTLKDKK